MTETVKDIDPEILASLRKQIIQELDDRDVREKEKQDIKREGDLVARKEYVARMKDSPDPWMELVGISADDGQIKIELDWNPAFVETLRKNGFVGPDEETVMQRYVAILAKSVAEDMTADDSGE